MAVPDALELADSAPHVVPEQLAPDRLHVTPRFWASFVTVAANCCVPPPTSTLAVVGDTATEIANGPVTVSVVDPLMPADAAWMVVVPVPTPLDTPMLLMVATAVFEELQLAVLVRFCVVPSL